MEVFIQIILLHLFAVASPGPDFILVARQSLRYGIKNAIWSSLGIAIGILFHVSFAMLGINILLAYHESFFLILKIIAASYLGYLGFRSLFIQSSAMNFDTVITGNTYVYKSFVAGFLTNISNPKAFLFFITVFAVIGNQLHFNFKLLSGLYMSLATFFWFSLMSYIISVSKKINTVSNFFPFLERITGLILVIISIQILFISL